MIIKNFKAKKIRFPSYSDVHADIASLQYWLEMRLLRNRFELPQSWLVSQNYTPINSRLNTIRNLKTTIPLQSLIIGINNCLSYYAFTLSPTTTMGFMKINAMRWNGRRTQHTLVCENRITHWLTRFGFNTTDRKSQLRIWSKLYSCSWKLVRSERKIE